MDAEPRSLPGRASLRHLQLEAKRRRVAGEFASLHEAQLAVAREHGLPSWAALKRLVVAQTAPSGHALKQLRWLIARFADANKRGWVAPGPEELHQHFDDRMLIRVTPGRWLSTITEAAPNLKKRLVVKDDTPLMTRVRLAGTEITATVEPQAPHRLTQVQRTLLGERVSDTRVATPPTHSTGEVPDAVAEAAERAFTELGLVGLLLAAGSSDQTSWAVARGWADLERARDLEPDQRFPAYGITHPVTATAVLRLVAAGRVAPDEPANDFLHTLHLADDAVTVRELLTHTGGVDHAAQVVADKVPELVALLGPIVHCSGERGAFHYSNEGFGVLGQLVADVSRSTYAEAVARLVFESLEMNESSFPARWPAGADTLVGYQARPDDTFAAVPALVATMPAAGGMWATAADIVRFGVGWPSLLPPALVQEALRPQAPQSPAGGQRGLGWLIDPGGEVVGSRGVGPGDSASLLVERDQARAYVALTNRERVPVDALNAQALRASVAAV